jgi:hypothetical protein
LRFSNFGANFTITFSNLFLSMWPCFVLAIRRQIKRILGFRSGALLPLQRGGEVTAACTRTDPIEMVTIKKLSSDDFKQFRSCQHKYLFVIIEAYRFKNQIFAITNYIVTFLIYIITIPLQLEELYVSATC